MAHVVLPFLLLQLTWKSSSQLFRIINSTKQTDMPHCTKDARSSHRFSTRTDMGRVTRGVRAPSAEFTMLLTFQVSFVWLRNQLFSLYIASNPFSQVEWFHIWTLDLFGTEMKDGCVQVPKCVMLLAVEVTAASKLNSKGRWKSWLTDILQSVQNWPLESHSRTRTRKC